MKHGSTKTIGYKINNDIAYIPDVKTIPKKTIKKILNIKYLIIDCFRTKEHNLHVSLKETLNYINLIKPEKAFLTHMSKDLDYNNLKNKLKIKSLPFSIYCWSLACKAKPGRPWYPDLWPGCFQRDSGTFAPVAVLLFSAKCITVFNNFTNMLHGLRGLPLSSYVNACVCLLYTSPSPRD